VVAGSGRAKLDEEVIALSAWIHRCVEVLLSGLGGRMTS
jgi:hypothetical protein